MATAILLCLSGCDEGDGDAVKPEEANNPAKENESKADAESGGGSTMSEYASERARLNKTVWATEKQATQYEQALVRLWDDLLRQDRRPDGDKYGVFGSLEFYQITVAEPAAPSPVDLGVMSHPPGQEKQTMDLEQWQAFVAQIKDAGYALVQSEWHHSAFEPHDDGTADSTVSMALYVTHEKSKLRAVVHGALRIKWGTRKDRHGHPRPRSIDASGLKMLSRRGDPGFGKVAEIDPSTPGKPLGVHPIFVHDLDGDGLSEIILGGQGRIYRNRGAGNFEHEPLFTGDASTPPTLTMPQVALLADVTGDGVADYLAPSTRGDLLMYRGNKDGRFNTAPEGHSQDGGPLQNAQVMTAGDVDADGDLDLWIGQYRPAYRHGQMPTPYYDANDGLPSFLLLNDGTGRFIDATEAAGLTKRRFRRTYAASFIDLDEDKDLDLLVVSDFAGVDMYLNDGKGSFSDANSRILGDRHLFGMAAAFGDYNLDGRLDFYVAGMGSTTARRLDRLGLGRDDMPEVHQMRTRMGYGNRMYLATDEGYVEPEFKDQVARTGWTWGMAAIDFDNDGDRDIFAANGHVSGESTKDHCTHFWCHDIYTNSSKPDPELAKLFDEVMSGYLKRTESWDGYQKNALLMNLDGKGFVNVAFLMGVADQFDSRAVLGDDLDGDGKMDLLVVEFNGLKGQKLHVYRNQLESGNHWIGVRLREEGPGRSPIGATITVEAGGRKYVGRITTGETISAQHANTIHFGLGQADHVERLHIQWPSGATRTIEAPDADRYHQVSAPVSE